MFRSFSFEQCPKPLPLSLPLKHISTKKFRQKNFFWRKFFTLPLHLQTSSPQYRPAFYRPSKSNPFSGGFHSDISASHSTSSSGKSVKRSPGKNKEQQNEYTVPLKKSPQAMRRLRRFGGDGGIWTPARLAAPTGFRIRTLQPLGYISSSYAIMPQDCAHCKEKAQARRIE